MEKRILWCPLPMVFSDYIKNKVIYFPPFGTSVFSVEFLYNGTNCKARFLLCAGWQPHSRYPPAPGGSAGRHSASVGATQCGCCDDLHASSVPPPLFPAFPWNC